MQTSINPWAQYFDPKNLTVYNTEALGALKKPDSFTIALSAYLDSDPVLLVDHWLNDSQKVAAAIERFEPKLCLKLLLMTQMPHYILPIAEALLCRVFIAHIYEPGCSTSDFRTIECTLPLPSDCSEPRASRALLSMLDPQLNKELHRIAVLSIRLLENDDYCMRKIELGHGRRTYSPKLRSRFLALYACARTHGETLYFITVMLSKEMNQKLLKSRNKRAAEQKVSRELEKVFGRGSVCGFCVIEPSPSTSDGHHIHMIISGAKLDGIKRRQLKAQLRIFTDPTVKTAVQIKLARNIKRMARLAEVARSEKYFMTLPVSGIDIGGADYVSKDLNESLLIHNHKQVFSINNDRYYKSQFAKAVSVMNSFLRERAKISIQLDSYDTALREIQLCFLELILNILTKLFKRKSILID